MAGLSHQAQQPCAARAVSRAVLQAARFADRVPSSALLPQSAAGCAFHPFTMQPVSALQCAAAPSTPPWGQRCQQSAPGVCWPTRGHDHHIPACAPCPCVLKPVNLPLSAAPLWLSVVGCPRPWAPLHSCCCLRCAGRAPLRAHGSCCCSRPPLPPLPTSRAYGSYSLGLRSMRRRYTKSSVEGYSRSV